MFEYKNQELTAIEIKLLETCNKEKIQEKIQNILGEKFKVKNRYQQNELLFKTMQSEKWMIFIILGFILMVASFNIIASLTMLIIDKKKDIEILKSLGANQKTIRNIFMIEGNLITITGILGGLFLGTFIAYLQQIFHIIPLQSNGSFIIDYYPVDVQFLDFIYITFIVFIIGFVASWYPAKFKI